MVIVLIILLSTILFLIIHSYLLYPVIIWCVAYIKQKETLSNIEYEPSISIIISAYNEENVIRKRIENIFQQNYPHHLLEVLIGSDCSDDRTNAILLEMKQTYAELSIFLFEKRRGKAAVVNDLVQHARHDILVFSDANTEYTSGALRLLVQDFKNDEIGGISGRIHFIESHKARRSGVEEGNYFHYDSFIKKSEGNCGILIGAFGGFFAIRRILFTEIPLDKAVTDDLFISLSILSSGYKLVYRPHALAYEESAENIKMEYYRKIRYAATNFQTLFYFRDLLFGSNLLLTYAFWSHKVIRWIVPLLLPLVLFLSIIVSSYHVVFSTLLFVQILFYGLALIGYVLSIMEIRLSPFSLPYYFVVSNFAILMGFIRFLRGRHTIIWKPSR